MRIFIKAFTAATAAAVLISVPAYSQQENKAPLTRRSEAQQKDDAEIDKAYRAATKGEAAPAAAAKTDPWRTVRPPDADKPKR